jgi:hypothetical protein
MGGDGLTGLPRIVQVELGGLTQSSAHGWTLRAVQVAGRRKMRPAVLNITAQGRRKPVTYVTNQDDENAESTKTEHGPSSLAGQWPRSLRSGQELSTPSFGSQSGQGRSALRQSCRAIGPDRGTDASRRIRHRCGVRDIRSTGSPRSTSGSIPRASVESNILSTIELFAKNGAGRGKRYVFLSK